MLNERQKQTFEKVGEKLRKVTRSSASRPWIKMLNERQKQVLVEKVNRDLDIPWVTEGMEERIITKLVDRVAPKVEPSLLAIMPAVYVTCIKLALDENVPIKERKDRISEIMRAELAGPLARELNLRVDVKLVPEKMEGAVLKVVSKKVIDEFVEWTVGHVSEKLGGAT